MNSLKLSPELAEEIRERVKKLDIDVTEKLARAKDQNGTFDVIISTENVDRQGDIVRQNGWDFTNYKKNPIVLWGHDYYKLPIGVCTDWYLTEQNGVPALGAKGFFYPADINPLAQQVRKMYEFGLKLGVGAGCTTSVGFIPRDFDPDNRSIITKAELLEFSFVPVPANQDVGPASGRALTFAEAKEIGLDMEVMRAKGLEFVEKTENEEEAEQKEEAGDDCTMDDGTAGELAAGDDGELVCVPKDDDGEKAAAERDSQKKLLKGLTDEHARHAAEIEKAFDELRVEENVAEQLKDLRDVLRDEQTMHRARSIACFRDFSPAEDKAFDTKSYLKTVREAHEAYETATGKIVDEFEAKLASGERDEHFDWLSEKLDEAGRAHKKAITKTAKTMCKAVFGEDEPADEEVLNILNNHLKTFVPEPLQRAVFQKVGAQISAATKKKLGEAHEHLKAASAVLEALHPGLADGDGEESRSNDAEKSAPSAPVKPRSKPRPSSRSDEALKAHLQAREIVGGIEAAARAALSTINAEVRARSKK